MMRQGYRRIPSARVSPRPRVLAYARAHVRAPCVYTMDRTACRGSKQTQAHGAPTVLASAPNRGARLPK